MSHKIELTAFIVAGIASSFGVDLIQKIVITTIAMVVGTTVAFYWKRYLENKNKKE